MISIVPSIPELHTQPNLMRPQPLPSGTICEAVVVGYEHKKTRGNGTSYISVELRLDNGRKAWAYRFSSHCDLLPGDTGTCLVFIAEWAGMYANQFKFTRNK